MGVEAPETCWATHKRQVNTYDTVASGWLIYLNSMMMYGPANVKNVYSLNIFVQNIAC